MERRVERPGTHKGPSAPNLTPCHYISHGTAPALCARSEDIEDDYKFGFWVMYQISGRPFTESMIFTATSV